MATVVTCPHCEGQCAVEEKHLGMALKCPRCSEQFNAEASEGGGGAVRSRRPAPAFDRGSVRDRAAVRGKETGMEKYFVVGMLALVGIVIVLWFLVGGGSAAEEKARKIGVQKTLLEQAETDPAMREKLRREEERKRYYEQQEQTPGAKAAYERQLKEQKKK